MTDLPLSGLKDWYENGHAVLGHYGFSADSRFDLFSISENATYKVTDPQSGKIAVLRLSRPGYRSKDQIASEIAWIKALRADGVTRTPEVIDTVEGASIAVFRDKTGAEQCATMFGYASGEILEEHTAVTSFKELGEIAAKLHSHSDAWARPEGFTRPNWDVETSFGKHGHWGYWGDNETLTDEDRDLFELVDQKIRSDIAAYGAPEHRHGLIHGDMRLANFIVDDAGIQLIDFDDCGDSWHLYELGCAMSFIEASDQAPALVRAWLDGYTRLRPLNAADLSVLPAMIMKRRLLLTGWFHTHSHVTELADLAACYVSDARGVAKDFLADRYLVDL